MSRLMVDDGALFAADKLKAPDGIIGQHKTPGGFTKTTPREWTEPEIQWMLQKKAEGQSVDALAEALDRSSVSVQIKLKRLSKSHDKYNDKNRDSKYQANAEFLTLINPKTVLDVFAGNSWWAQNARVTVTNDKDEKFETDYSLDALDMLCKMRLDGRRFDIVDLDPYGSAYECFDLALKIAKRGIIVSFGEWGHKRWKRFDYVKPRYGITELDDFGEGELFIQELQRVAACNKKHAEPVIVLQYSNFVRVYFELTEVKILEQWDDK